MGSTGDLAYFALSALLRHTRARCCDALASHLLLAHKSLGRRMYGEVQWRRLPCKSRCSCSTLQYHRWTNTMHELFCPNWKYDVTVSEPLAQAWSWTVAAAGNSALGTMLAIYGAKFFGVNFNDVLVIICFTAK